MKRHAIVGFGCAGYSAAKAIRETAPEDEIHVFEKTTEPPANPMLTTYYASGKLDSRGIYPFGSLEKIQGELNVSVQSGTAVKKVYPASREVELEGGSRLAYDDILIATGAHALLPPIEGLPDERVFLMRTMDDARKMKAFLARRQVKKAVVVGASMVGIKVAELLLNAGVDTAMADFASYLFPLAAYENVAREIEKRVAARGVHFLWNAGIQAVTPRGARFSTGDELEADIICLCIGTRANVELVANTQVVEGQPLDIRKGIVVNDRMETSAPGVYAAGDCCEGTNLQTGETMIIGLWANAGCQGETAGVNMAGGSAEYKGNIVHNITHFMEMDFIGLGDVRLPGETVSFGSLEEGNYVQAVMKDGALQSVNILGNFAVSGLIKSWLMKKLEDPEAELTDMQRGLLIKNGLSAHFVDLIGGEGK